MFRRTVGGKARAANRPVLRLGVSLALTLFLVAATPLTEGTGFLADLEAKSLDARFRLRGPVQPGSDVALVMIDEKTVDAYGRWPLPRDRLAEAVRHLKAAGASVIGFDLLFLEEGSEDRLPAWAEETIRAALGGASDERPVLERLIRLNPSGDALADAAAAAGNVFIPFAFVAESHRRENERRTPAVDESAYAAVRMPGDVAASESPFRAIDLVTPGEALLTAAVATGHVTVTLAGDGSLRHHYPAIRYESDHFPSLPIELARLYRRVPKDEVAVLYGSGIEIGGRLLPTDGRMRFLLDYYGPEATFPTWSLVDVLEGRVPERAFRQRVVLIGASATGAADTFATPFTATMPGTEYFATAVENILQGRLLRRDDTTAGIDILGILAGGMLAAVAGYLAPVVVAAAVALVLLLGWGFLAYFAFAGSGLWLGTVLPATAIVLNFGVQEVWGALVERKRRRVAERQRLNLSRYFAPSIVDAVANRDAPIAAARSHEAAVLFVDLSGFTGLCERLPPEEALPLLRRFYRLVEGAVFAHRGTLDKFIGDGALAVFGVPVPGTADAADALRCARRLLVEISEWRAELAASDESIDATIGIHFGPVLAGDVGGERQFQYTVTGDTVNVASRLQSLCRELGVRLVVSSAAICAAQREGGFDDTLLRSLQFVPELRVRGREQPIAVWIGGRGDGVPFSED